MIWLAIAILSLLAFLNYRLGGKVLYPPFVFCAVWAFDLYVLWLAGDFFYQIREETLFLFICGAALFSLSGWLAFGWRKRQPKLAPAPEFSQRIINRLLAALIWSLPIYLWWVHKTTADIEATSFFAAARRVTIEQRGTVAFSIFGNLLDLSVLVALLAVYERDNHRKRAFWAVVVSLTMCLLLGAKIYMFGLLISLFCIEALKTGRVRWKVALIVGLSTVVILSILFYFVIGFENLSLKNLFSLYTSGGMVGFDRALRDPNKLPHDSDPFTFIITRILVRLGLSHAPLNYEGYEFVGVGPFGLQGNVYTMYFSYIDWGYAGMIAVAGVFGFVITAIYRKALERSRMCVLLYASMFPGLILSPYDDGLSGPFLWFKVCALAWIIYSFPCRWRQFRAMLSWRTTRAAAHVGILLPP